jgi:heme-degrading monooxygenase HmoA
MIRVIIERKISDGCVDQYLELIRRARKKANTVDGFIAGELLQEKDKPQHAIIISSWENNDAWDAWAISEERLNALEGMRSLLDDDEKVTILENSNILL